VDGYFWIKSSNNNNENIPSSVQVEPIPISDNFQIFITCCESRSLSPALLSRCFCVHLESPELETDFLELADIILSGSSTTARYSQPFSEVLSKVFCQISKNILEEKTEKTFLFSNDSFTSHRVVNCARGIGNYILNKESFAAGLKFSFVSSFKEFQFQEKCFNLIIKILESVSKNSQLVIENTWEELCIQAHHY